MPFLCVRDPDPRNLDFETGGSAAPFGGVEESEWRRLDTVSPAALWWQSPCGVWQGRINGSTWHLLCDGFIARPRPFDAVTRTGDLEWLAAALAWGGADALEALEGQYALCLFNEDTGDLFVARDRLGGETAYWHRSGEISAVASRSRDLVHLPTCPPTENPGFVAESMALRGGHTPGTTPFVHVNEVLPGARVRLSAGAAHVERTPLAAASPDRYRSPGDWVDAFRDRFQQAVYDAVDRSGDVSVMLSGGLDSVPVLVSARRCLRSQGRRLTAVSWLLPDWSDSDESHWIRMAADAAGVELLAFDGGGYMPYSDLTSSAVLSPELPYYNSVRGILLSCYQRAAESGSVIVLAATRGDMIYPGRFAVVDDLIRRRDWRHLWAEVGRLYHHVGLGGMYRDAALRYPLSRVKRRLRGPGRNPVAPWLTDHARACIPANPQWPPEAAAFPNPEHARQMLGPAMTFGSAHEKHFARRYGVDRRDPFHSKALVELMLHAPVLLSHMKGQDKWIMREAMRGTIPEPIRVKKRTGLLHGFNRTGFEQNRRRIRELLLDQNEDVWARYIEPGYVRDVLSRSEPSDKGVMVINGCIGYTLWRGFWDHAMQ